MSDASIQDFKSKQSSKKTVIDKVQMDGKDVYICKPSAADRGSIQRALLRDDEAKFYNSRLVIAVACDKDGSKLFTEKDEAWLSELDFDVLQPIIDKANSIKKADPAKNSDGGSGTA